jgi:hypothetical protein
MQGATIKIICGDISVLVNIGIAIQKYTEIKIHGTKS